MNQTDLFASYDPRFMDNFLGVMGKNPIIAIIELIANAWDAGSRNVYISWPVNKELANPKFEIIDDGNGLSYEEFQKIWGTLNYNRLINQGDSIIVRDESGKKLETRSVFGKNGKGRFSPFCFNDYYQITSIKDGIEFSCKVTKTIDANLSPFIFTEFETLNTTQRNGIKISTPISKINTLMDVEVLRKEISARFVARPTFNIFINKTQLTLEDIPSDCILIREIYFKENLISLKLIDTNKADMSTRQRGIAWWVQGRLVGNVNWRLLKNYDEFDQRSSSAKRFNLIIEADCLNNLGLVLPDWSGFDLQHELWSEFEDIMIPAIKEIMQVSAEKEATRKANRILSTVELQSRQIGNLSKSKITSFVDETVRTCPNLTDNVLFNITTILINLEKSSNKFNLIQKLASIPTDGLDKLDSILEDWGIDMAKIILDEIEERLKTINEFEERIKIIGIKEVQELQALFNNGLWMFGASFESIDFSSNKGMTNVLKNLFGIKETGSKNRPDYVILPNDKSSLGAYSRPKFDDVSFEEIGVEHVVIVDLKTTGLVLGSDEKNQIWKYIKELEEKGAITKNTKIHGFVLGDNIESGENSPRKEWNDNVIITPLLYSVLLSRAKNRMLKLSDKVSSAPVLKQHLQEERERLNEIYASSINFS